MTDDTLAYEVTFRRRQRNIILRVQGDGSLTVSAPHGTPQARIDEFVASKQRWISRRRAAAADLPPRVERDSAEFRAGQSAMRGDLATLMPLWCERMGVATQPRVTIKVMSTRWGSCNARLHKINLNVELARRGTDALEYVLVHELAHLFHQNHGPGFYALMDEMLPDWRARRKALRALQ
ncbi:M48 family metallopeptidase [Demequina sp. NBRC 110057]|uniref:M48 family metallopeptidase n=1 Tax=Demequina sp. NBRC 110057 TaxID=1570346 RepID=UPI0009FBC93B|nr:SprT-like domain-containing protein [Demequina sp. NBRC 110057]